MRHRAKQLHEDRSGLALVEFAVTLPVLLVLFLGSYQLSDAIACQRKVGIANRTIADLGSRSHRVTPADVDEMLAAAVQVMTPYSAAPAQLRMSQVFTNASGQTSVVWSRGRRTPVRAVGSRVAVPKTLATPNTYLILSEISYSYDPMVRFAFVGQLQLTDFLFMSPRNSIAVQCDDC